MMVEGWRGEGSQLFIQGKDKDNTVEFFIYIFKGKCKKYACHAGGWIGEEQ